MLPALFQEIAAKKWRVLLFISIVLSIVLAINLMLPKQYLAQASLLPANSRMMDKQRLYGDNIQELYSSFGTGEDLDRVFAALHSSTVLQKVVDSLSLVDHYRLQHKKNARSLAYKQLNKNIKCIRSEYGELQLYVWDQDTTKALQITSLLINRTQSVFDNMYKEYYDRSITNLNVELADTVAKGSSAEAAFMKTRISEFEVARLNPPPAFMVMEPPVVSTIPDKPNIAVNVLAAFAGASFLALFFMAIRLAFRAA